MRHSSLGYALIRENLHGGMHNMSTSSLADLIAPQLPYLRRFARALMGSQDRGDAYVVAMLEALVADNRIFDRDVAPRTAAYKAFINVWNSVPTNGRADPAGDIADRRIETLNPGPRQAFLLAAVEEFSTRDIAIILGKSEDEIAELIDAAGKEIAEQLASRVLIIEDEPLIALDIEGLVTDIGHEVVGVAATHKEALAFAREKRPELILADIQLADGSSGIEAVNEILMELNVPVIFITAYPERLLTGDKPEPAFLVTKPFKHEMVKAVISQALFFDVKAGVKQHGAAA
jgi:DNA-directed RNA polymerase specialized sigma24 family protein/CheY-like chemotaxis protein